MNYLLTFPFGSLTIIHNQLFTCASVDLLGRKLDPCYICFLVKKVNIRFKEVLVL